MIFQNSKISVSIFFVGLDFLKFSFKSPLKVKPKHTNHPFYTISVQRLVIDY